MLLPEPRKQINLMLNIKNGRVGFSDQSSGVGNVCLFWPTI
jgi:hypothetical protein